MIILIATAAFVFALAVGVSALDRRREREQRLAAQREQDIRNRRAYELNRSTTWNG